MQHVEISAPTVTVKLRIAKFDGEYEEGKEPVEVIETEQIFPLSDFLALQQPGGE
jgi:hypothetical protein